MRKKIVAGNWKMNLLPAQGAALIADVNALQPIIAENNVVVFCTPFTHFTAAKQSIKAGNHANVLLGAQNCYHQASGAFTGEISLDMLQDCGVQAVIIGHSERRQYFAETNEMLRLKLDAVLAKSMMPLFCCGESLDVRNANQQNNFVAAQLQESVFHLSAEQIVYVVIAYEPIWAIGTGVTASTQQAQDMHAFIRSSIANQYGADIANQISILYGGSCNASNAQELFSQADVDGGLIGGAALKADSFVAIINAMNTNN
jgi:triosephosphate isomerase (TIM)